LAVVKHADIKQKVVGRQGLNQFGKCLTHAADAAKVGLFEWNVKTGQVMWSEQEAALFGLPVKQSGKRGISRPSSHQEWARCVHPEDLPRMEKLIRRCIRKGLPLDSEYRVVWPNGEVRWLRGTGEFRYDQSGKVQCMLGVDIDVTEHVRMRAALEESEARYRTLFEQSADGIVVVNQEGKILMVNRSLEELFRYRRGDLLGKPVEILIAKRFRKDHAKLRGAYATPLLQRMPGRPSVFGQRKDGTEFPVEFSLSFAWTRDDGIVTAIVRDATERVEHEAKLREAAASLERRASERAQQITAVHHELREILESIGDGFIACDRDWRLIYINRAAEKTLAFQREEVLGKTFWELFPLTIGTRLEREYRAAAAGEAREFENLYEPWGRWFYNRCYPREGGGAAIYFTEITGRKHVEEALQQNQQYLRALIDNAPVAILSTNQDGIVEALNPAALQLFGYTEGEMLGQSIGQFMNAGDQGPPESFLPNLLRMSGTPVLGMRREVLGRCRDRKIIVLDVTVAEFHAGNSRRFLVMARDITGVKRLERELLEGAERERHRLGHDLHDGLGQHLHAIYYRATLLHKELLEKKIAHAKEVAGLSKLLHQALDLARGLARGLQPVSAMPEGLMAALKDLSAQTRKLFGVKCRFECPSPVLVSGHNAATHLYRIAQEAVNNAIRHGRPSQIRIKLDSDAEKIVLGIQDNGKGISSKNGDGKGLGLHIMQYRADAVNGSLVVHSTSQRGTEVFCTVRRDKLQAKNITQPSTE
jgi:PAS domain S-box-containing protein